MINRSLDRSRFNAASQYLNMFRINCCIFINEWILVIELAPFSFWKTEMFYLKMQSNLEVIQSCFKQNHLETPSGEQEKKNFILFHLALTKPHTI